VLLDEPTYPGIWVASRPIGASWIGTPGGREAKLVCVPEGDPAYAEVHDVDDLPPHVTEEIGQFFEVYKGLDKGSSSTDEGREGRVSALRVVEEARERSRSEQQ
jgi:inorganic pyrophosphatase